MPFRSRTSLTAVPNDSDHDIPIPFLNDKGSPGNLEKTASMGTALSDTLVGSSLPTPVVQSRRGKKNARIERGLKVHWAYFKRRLGTVTAPSTSSAFEPDDGDSYTTGQAPLLHMGEDEADGVDEVVVDREWSQEMKSSITHSEYGTPDRASNAFGTTIDRESLFAHPEGRWAKFGPLVLLRWRCWPVVYDFFVSRFVDAKSERHYNRENWFLKKVRNTHVQCLCIGLIAAISESGFVVVCVSDRQLGTGGGISPEARHNRGHDICLCGMLLHSHYMTQYYNHSL